MQIKNYLSEMVKSMTIVAVLTVGVTTVTTAFSPSVVAAEKGQKLSAKMKPLGDAQKLLGEKKFKEALGIINDQVVPISGKTPYEEYVTNELKAACLQGMKDYAGVAKIYETMLASNQGAPEQAPARILLISQIAFQQKDYPKSIQFAERYVKENGSTPAVMEQLAQAYYMKGDYKIASDYATKLIAQAEQAKKAPEKLWLDILLGSQFKLENKVGVVSTLEKVLTYYPDPKAWKDVFKYLVNSANYSERESLEILRMKKTLGILNPEDYNTMTELALAMNSPGDAKSTLEAGIASGDIKAGERTTRLLAKAKADVAADLASIDTETKDAQAKGNAEALAKIGAAYLGHGQNDKAVSAIQAALAKGGLKNPDESNLRLGVAYVNLGNKAEAVKAFQKVSPTANLASLARLWVIYTNSAKK
ncbi:MAG: hypothetical protein RL154_943 [Pseudomonadota bacterium]